jgi:hypothetical protein
MITLPIWSQNWLTFSHSVWRIDLEAEEEAEAEAEAEAPEVVAFW